MISTEYTEYDIAWLVSNELSILPDLRPDWETEKRLTRSYRAKVRRRLAVLLGDKRADRLHLWVAILLACTVLMISAAWLTDTGRLTW